MRLQVDHLILEALKEDISSEDVTTNSVMKEYVKGEVQLICKQNGIISGLEVFKRVFELLDERTEVIFYCKDKNGISKPWQGDFDEHMSDKNATLVFE